MVIGYERYTITAKNRGRDWLMSDTKIQWHPGFVAALDLEFRENREDLIYLKEYNLNTKPLEIDLLVIKKGSNVRIVNEIGKVFRGHNIVEYKSREDHCDIDTFYKTGAYGCLYKAMGKTVDERKAADITVTIIRDAKPCGLFHYFKKRHVKVTNPYAGIYYVHGEVLFQTQIVVGRELKPENHIWIKALSDRLQKQELENLLERRMEMAGKFDRELADSVLEVSVKANKRIAEELRGGNRMYKAWMEIIEPDIDKLIEERIEKKLDERVEKELGERVEKELGERVEKELGERVEKELGERVEKELDEATKKLQRESITNAIRGFRDLGADDGKIQELLINNYGMKPEEITAYL